MSCGSCGGKLTDLGYRAALYLTKLHQPVLTPTLDSLDPVLREALAGSAHELDQAPVRLDDDFTALAQICGLQLAT